MTEIRSEDVINGTREKILQEYRENVQYKTPAFVLLGSAPASSMVGTDMEEAACSIQAIDGVPTLAVDVTGFQSFDAGIAQALLGMAKLLTEPCPTEEGTLNLLGGTELDIGKENMEAVKSWCKAQGYTVLSVWGGKETARNLRRAGAAEVNLVVTESGLAAARWMREELGIPYIMGAPFGRTNSEALAEGLRRKTQPATAEPSGERRALILAEQFTANAIRETLRANLGFGQVQVCSFLAVNWDCAQTGDKRLKSEAQLSELLADYREELVIADPAYKACGRENRHWIDLPLKGFLTPTGPVPVIMGVALDAWLEQELKK